MNMFQTRFPLNCSTTPGSCNRRYAYDSLRTNYVSKLSMFYERDPDITRSRHHISVEIYPTGKQPRSERPSRLVHDIYTRTEERRSVSQAEPGSYRQPPQGDHYPYAHPYAQYLQHHGEGDPSPGHSALCSHSVQRSVGH